MQALCLFDGYGGFELGLRLAGLPIRAVCRVERDSHAAAVLAARMGEGLLTNCPIWDDVTTFDGRPWRGRVDLITGGFPCQPFSAAGQRRGVDDERWLWDDIARIIADVGPRYVFLENVPGLVRAGLPHVLADLAELGFDAEWGRLSAAAVGAPHRRERLWILAVADGERQQGRWVRQHKPAELGTDVGHSGGSRRPEVTRGTPGDEGPHGRQPHRGDVAIEDVADADDIGGRGVGDAVGRPGRRTETPRSGEDVANPERSRPEGRSERQVDSLLASQGSRQMVWPPPPDDLAEWLEYITQGGPQPSIRRSTDGRPVGLAESLHLGGNGLVPRVAAVAFRQLLERADMTDNQLDKEAAA